MLPLIHLRKEGFNMFGGKMGVMELILILAIVLVIFGPKQLPKLSKMFGKTISSFKNGLEEGLDEGNGAGSDNVMKTEASADEKPQEDKNR